MIDSSSTWLDYMTAAGAVATPILVAILGGIGWRIRNRIDRRAELESKLREDRITIYNELLEPFVIIFMSEEAWKSDPKNEARDKNAMGATHLLSLDYKRNAFRLAVLGSDGVLRAYNSLMQYFFLLSDHSAPDEARVKGMLDRIGMLLLEIRRSMGNESTSLDRWEMLEWFMTDMKAVRGK